MKRQMRVIYCVIVVGILLFAGIFEDAATQTRKLSLEELAKKSELIVTGRVIDKQSEWNKEKTRIYTRVTISVDEYHKGESSENAITVTLLGGEVGDVGELYTGTARFEKDEDVVLFLRKDLKGNLRVAGSNQGKYGIRTDEVTGKKMISQRKSLDDFKSQVKGIVKQQKLE
jgi:hypothetical protein